jgi:hypothetical protein
VPGDAWGSDGSFPDPVLTGARVGRPDPAQAGTLLPVLAPIGREPDAPKQVTNQTRPPPHPSTPPTPPSARRRRLANAMVPHHLLSPTPYRDALMAGRGRFHRRVQEGRGASAAQPRAAGDRGEHPRWRDILCGCEDAIQADRGEQLRGRGRGRGDAPQAEGDRVERGASARGGGGGGGGGGGAPPPQVGPCPRSQRSQ